MTQKSSPPILLVEPVSEKDHVRGPYLAPLTLLEYGDYECPYCFRAYPIVNEIRRRLGERLRFVFRNFPQNSVHPHASIAAQAAEAAAAQGKFWEMHDFLYEHQADLASLNLSHAALQLGMEIYRFEADLSSEIFSHRVRKDFQTGLRGGVTATPAFFINDARYTGDIAPEPIIVALTAHEKTRPKTG